MILTFSHQPFPVSFRSKQIRKSRRQEENKQETQQKDKKYQTYSKQVVKAILYTFRQEVAKILDRQHSWTDKEFIQILNTKEQKDDINNALITTLTQHVLSLFFKSQSQSLDKH